MLDQNSGVERHVVDALFRLVLDHVEQVVGGELLELFLLLNCLVDRNRADWNGRGVDDRLSNRVDVAAGGEVHHRVGAVLHSHAELFDFAVDVG